jgi:hypothetical protein
MRIYTIRHQEIKPYAEVEKITLSNGTVINAITVGEKGRGRHMEIIPIVLLNEENKKVTNVTLGTTKSGKPKFIEIKSDEDNEIVVVQKHKQGFRGHLEYWGDYHVKEIPETEELVKKYGRPSYYCRYEDNSEIIHDGDGYFLRIHRNKYCLKDIAVGRIADGDAGRVGSAEQKISIGKPGDIWGIKRTGRLYGNPSTYFYHITAKGINVATRQEREITDCF